MHLHIVGNWSMAAEIIRALVGPSRVWVGECLSSRGSSDPRGSSGMGWAGTEPILRQTTLAQGYVEKVSAPEMSEQEELQEAGTPPLGRVRKAGMNQVSSLVQVDGKKNKKIKNKHHGPIL